MQLYTDTHILIIEDEPDLLANLCGSLRDSDYKVDGALCGKEGLTKALNHNFDLIVLDMMLPNLDGLGVLEQLRQQKNTPVILLTALSDIESKLNSFNLGADDYLTKPFHLKELKARISNILKKTREPRAQHITINTIKINTIKRQVWRENKAIALTHREYAITEYLALHRGKVVSRDAIHELFFDDNEDSLSNVLDVNISTIRKKLGKDLIQTKRGVGYCIP